MKKVFEWLTAILTGYSRLGLRMTYLEEAVRKSDKFVETRLTYINHELDDLRLQGRKDQERQDRVAEDVAFIRGKLDR